jgi:hypothetical protein
LGEAYKKKRNSSNQTDKPSKKKKMADAIKAQQQIQEEVTEIQNLQKGCQKAILAYDYENKNIKFLI